MRLIPITTILAACIFEQADVQLDDESPVTETPWSASEGEDDDGADDGDGGEGTSSTWYFDGDGDGFGLTSSAVTGSKPSDSTSWVTMGGDCNDASASINPDATEIAGNTVDEDCDGILDNEDGSTSYSYYVDSDGDGYGSTTTVTSDSSTPASGQSTLNTDCDDTDSSVYPGATETTDGEDDDCDGSVDESSSGSSTSTSVEVCYQPLSGSSTWTGYAWTNNPWNQTYWFASAYASASGTTKSCGSALGYVSGATVEINGLNPDGDYMVGACDGSTYAAMSSDGTKCMFAYIWVNGTLLGSSHFSSDSYDAKYTLP